MSTTHAEDARDHRIEALGALQEARVFLAEAEALDAAGFPGPALRSAFYAMDYAARGLLLAEDVRPLRHRAVVRAFAERAARADGVPLEAVGDLSLVLAARFKSDYDAGFRIAPEDAAWALERAGRFLALIEERLG